MIQRYDMTRYGLVWEEACMSRDVEELEAEHQKLLQAHTIMKEALEWLTTDACFLNCSHMSKRDFAVKALQRVAEVMP